MAGSSRMPWFPISFPAATIRRTSASRPATRSPSRKNVAWAP